MTLARTMVVHGPGSDRYREEVITSQDDTVVLSVWDAGEPNAPVLVFAPGTMTHPLVYAESLDAIAAAGISVVGVHPVGHGASPPGRDVLRLATIVRNARDAVAWAAEHFQGPIVLSGSSQGGIVALLAATDANERVRLCLPHNVLLPDLPQTLTVTRLPRSWQRHYLRLRRALTTLARVLPRLPVPFEWYLDPKRVFTNRAERLEFEADPRSLRRYPLRMVADLVDFDTSPITDGSINVPVVILAASGDPLFTSDYVAEVAAKIAAPSVSLVVLDLPMHLIFVAAPRQTADAVVKIVTDHLG